MKHAHAPLLSRPEAAEQLAISIRTLDALIAAGEIPVIRIGKSVRIRPAELDRFIAAREGYGPAAHRGGRRRSHSNLRKEAAAA